ncbi:hypothetical protein AAG570_013281 [Ranatra chinensis]|uniref:Protein SZT2 n=1 Tax=Ranatra chinensis TaxID=642074 RepID=A0ABD0Z2K4_9HEMI
MPNFWLILKVNKNLVVSYFHCRFLEFNCDEVLHYKGVHSCVLESIDVVCKTVNQTLLLQSLHDSRICDPLLEPDTGDDDIWTPNQSTNGVDDIHDSYLENDSKFLPGCFSCPVVWQSHFLLHPRLKTGPGKSGLSRAIQALRTVLNRFSVNNRKNMFVYQDSSGNNVFYLRLHENVRCPIRQSGMDDDSSPGSVSRSSSINSLNNKKTPDETNIKEIRPRVKSFGEIVEKEHTKHEDFLTLKVHGITEAGPEIKHELVQVLQNRLDDAVLEVLSVMLARNPMCKLSTDDVHFIQKTNYEPDLKIQLSIPEYTFRYLQPLSYYLRQNLLQFLFLPKYTDMRYQFQDYSEVESCLKRMPDSNIYLYNQSPVSGSKGIACLAIGVLDNECHVIKLSEFKKPIRNVYEDVIIEKTDFQTLTHSEVYNVDSESDHVPEAIIEVRLWKQGRVNIESLIQKCLTPVALHRVYHDIMPYWLKFGNELNVPSVRMHTFSLTSRHAVGVTLKEVHALVKQHESSSYLFYVNSEKTAAFTYHPGNEWTSSGRCFLIARNPSLWRLSIDSLHTEKDFKVILGQKGIQRFQQFYSVLPDGTTQQIPRQRFLIALINNNEVSLYTYNWAKDHVENLIKSLTQLGLWLSARSNFLTGILTQKMGLFHNQPYTRKSPPQLNNIEATELESLLMFLPSGTIKKNDYGSLASVHNILHDSKPPSFRRRSSDPVIANVYQIFEIRTNESKELQKKLFLMWQSRGATPNAPLTEDILDLFMQYSRIIHYCLTPLLFLPQWRLQSAATRDHNLKFHGSQASFPEIVWKNDDKWHQLLCGNFINEYKQYLQTLGFIPIQIASSIPRKL